MFRPSDNHLAYFRTFPCVDVQNCTISDTKLLLSRCMKLLSGLVVLTLVFLTTTFSTLKIAFCTGIFTPIEPSYKFKLLTLMVELS